jgi:hypothetical protein
MLILLAQLNIYPVECLPNEIFIQLNATPVQPGRSEFHRGNAYSTGTKSI